MHDYVVHVPCLCVLHHALVCSTISYCVATCVHDALVCCTTRIDVWFLFWLIVQLWLLLFTTNYVVVVDTCPVYTVCPRFIRMVSSCTQLYLLLSVLIPAFEVSVLLAFTIAWRITFNSSEFKRVCGVYLDTLTRIRVGLLLTSVFTQSYVVAGAGLG